MREEKKTGGKIQGRQNANQTPKGRPMEKNIKDIGVSFDALVHELLGLDPSALGKLSPSEDTVNGASCAGLGTFMRRTLQRSLTLVGRQEATLRLHTDVSAQAHGWPDRKVADLHEIFVWTLIREPRRFHARSFVPLLAADHHLVELPQRPDGCFSSLSTVDLVAEAQWRLDVVIDWMRDAAHTANPVSIRALIRRKLGISPETLMTHYFTSRDHAEAAFARDPDGQAASGLAALILSSLHSFLVMSVRQTSRIRLMTEGDAEEGRRPCARAANLTTILAASLHAEGGKEFRFEPPRERTEDERAFLRAVARYVYVDGSDEAGRALNLLVDGNLHFGAYTGHTLGDRLLHSVACECNPALKKMPVVVAV